MNYNFLRNLGYEDVSIEIARPGDSCRILHVMDIVQPRWHKNVISGERSRFINVKQSFIGGFYNNEFRSS